MSGLANLASELTSRVTTNLSASFTSLTVQQWIRLVAVIGAYLLARPYILKLASKRQMAALEQSETEDDPNAPRAPISANELRGQTKVSIPGDTDSEGEGEGGAAASGPDWGKKARRRQRRVVKEMLAAHEKRLQEEQEDEEDKDIAEFLVD
jgi:hypothetical protein